MQATLTINHWIEADRRYFRVKKANIRGALQGETGIINGVVDENKESIFYMLMFCLCVPQSKAIKAEEAIDRLRKIDFYTKGATLPEITKILTGLVRFQSVKANRLFNGRKLFLETSFWNDLKDMYVRFKNSPDRQTLRSIRLELIEYISGMGMKLASHFMRNVGMSGLAILDVHVIDGLFKRGVIDVQKISSSKTEYMLLETQMEEYASQVGISLDELDLLLWSQKTGYVFK